MSQNKYKTCPKCLHFQKEHNIMLCANLKSWANVVLFPDMWCLCFDSVQTKEHTKTQLQDPAHTPLTDVIDLLKDNFEDVRFKKIVNDPKYWY
jgi:hypothetical protein